MVVLWWNLWSASHVETTSFIGQNHIFVVVGVVVRLLNRCLRFQNQCFPFLVPVRLIGNVGLWLVARFTIVANFPNYSETHVLFGGLTSVAKKMGDFLFGKKTNCNCWEEDFFPKAIAKFKLPAFSKGANPLLNPC
jgi:type III secretory pathway component EscS